jgi:hypothetical protein
VDSRAVFLGAKHEVGLGRMDHKVSACMYLCECMHCNVLLGLQPDPDTASEDAASLPHKVRPASECMLELL